MVEVAIRRRDCRPAQSGGAAPPPHVTERLYTRARYIDGTCHHTGKAFCLLKCDSVYDGLGTLKEKDWRSIIYVQMFAIIRERAAKITDNLSSRVSMRHTIN